MVMNCPKCGKRMARAAGRIGSIVWRGWERFGRDTLESRLSGVVGMNLPHVLAEGAVEPDHRAWSLVWNGLDPGPLADGTACRQARGSGNIAHIVKCRSRTGRWQVATGVCRPERRLVRAYDFGNAADAPPPDCVPRTPRQIRAVQLRSERPSSEPDDSHPAAHGADRAGVHCRSCQ